MADSIDMSKQTGKAMHPKLKNLGTFAHPMGGYSKTGDFPDFRPKSVEKKKVLNETKAPNSHGQAGSVGVGENYADFKPKVKPQSNTRMTEKLVAPRLQNGGANANLASFDDPSYDTSPFAPQAVPTVKQGKRKTKKATASGIPFYGNV
jgi:hypothetical protein